MKSVRVPSVTISSHIIITRDACIWLIAQKDQAHYAAFYQLDISFSKFRFGNYSQFSKKNVTDGTLSHPLP